MRWISIKEQMPPKDITVLGYNNGEFVLIVNYNGIIVNENCVKEYVQFWCEITPPKEELLKVCRV